MDITPCSAFLCLLSWQKIFSYCCQTNRHGAICILTESHQDSMAVWRIRIQNSTHNVVVYKIMIIFALHMTVLPTLPCPGRSRHQLTGTPQGPSQHIMGMGTQAGSSADGLATGATATYHGHGHTSWLITDGLATGTIAGCRRPQSIS